MVLDVPNCAINSNMAAKNFMYFLTKSLVPNFLNLCYITNWIVCIRQHGNWTANLKIDHARFLNYCDSWQSSQRNDARNVPPLVVIHVVIAKNEMDAKLFIHFRNKHGSALLPS